ncbi:Uncharacterised protein [Mycobacteroides abscessus subsp. abscessus]|nr:Uncharacterised protein [Mycobacteroides abscessus subsp. abscessus]
MPDGPGSGLAVTPAVNQPCDRARRATDTTASARSCGSRTTPPAPTSSLPTSNWGLTMGRMSASGPAQAMRASSTSASEMNDRSLTMSCAVPPINSGVRVRTFVRSRTVTRSSDCSDQASWPYPTSAATTSRAPDRSNTSVNPPVEAPASRHRLPSTESPCGPKTSRAPRSLCAPRETHRSPASPCTTREAVAGTAVAAFTAGMPSMRTRPASISSAAC